MWDRPQLQDGDSQYAEDGLVSVEYRGLGTITQEEAGNCKHFIDEAYGGDLLAVCVEVHCAGWRMH